MNNRVDNARRLGFQSFVFRRTLDDLPTNVAQSAFGSSVGLTKDAMRSRESELHARVFMYRAIVANHSEFDALPGDVKNEIESQYGSCLVAISYISHLDGALAGIKNTLLEFAELHGRVDFQIDGFIERLVYNAIVMDPHLVTVELYGYLFPKLFGSGPLESLACLLKGYEEYARGEDQLAVVILRSLSGTNKPEAIGANMLLAEIYNCHAVPFEELQCLTALSTVAPRVSPDYPGIAALIAGKDGSFTDQLRTQLNRFLELLLAAELTETAQDLLAQARTLLIEIDPFERADIDDGKLNGIELVLESRDALGKNNAIREAIRHLILHSNLRYACLVNQDERLGETRNYHFSSEQLEELLIIDGIRNAVRGLDVAVQPMLAIGKAFDVRKWIILTKQGTPAQSLAVSLYYIENMLSLAVYRGIFIDTVLESSKTEEWFKQQEHFLDVSFDSQTFELVFKAIDSHFTSRSISRDIIECREF
jgi:hypothetical protein